MYFTLISNCIDECYRASPLDSTILGHFPLTSYYYTLKAQQRLAIKVFTDKTRNLKMGRILR